MRMIMVSCMAHARVHVYMQLSVFNLREMIIRNREGQQDHPGGDLIYAKTWSGVEPWSGVFYGVVLKMIFWSDIQSLLKSENDLDNSE